MSIKNATFTVSEKSINMPMIRLPSIVVIHSHIQGQISLKLVGQFLINFLQSITSHQIIGMAEPGRIAQSVKCLATDACLTADQGVASSIPVRSHTFVEIDHEMISTVILLLQLIHSRRVVVSYKRKYVHELLVNRLFKPAQEKVWLGFLTVPK